MNRKKTKKNKKKKKQKKLGVYLEGAAVTKDINRAKISG